MQERQSAGVTSAYALVTCLFFAWGFITSLIDPLVAAVKGIFQLSTFEANLSASAFFIAYGFLSFPAAVLLSRRKAVTTVLVALTMMVIGCMLILLAANVASYNLVLVGLFVLAGGITILQVAANPLAAALGTPERSHFRLTFSQAFNSLGTFIGPYLGAVLFLKGVEVKGGAAISDAAREASLGGIDRAFFWIAGLIILVALLIWSGRRLISTAAEAQQGPGQRLGFFAAFKEAFSSKWALLGGLAIFLYVGAEVAIGTNMALFLNQDSIWGVSLEDAGKIVSLYWGGAMVGRLVGSALLTRVPAPVLLTVFTGIATVLCLYVFAIGGVGAGYAAMSIGLFNSIMFPVIFTITLERSTASEEATSGFLITSIVGGAAIPPLLGLIADKAGAPHNPNFPVAFLLPALCYAVLCAFAIASRKAKVHLRDEPAAASIH